MKRLPIALFVEIPFVPYGAYSNSKFMIILNIFLKIMMLDNYVSDG